MSRDQKFWALMGFVFLVTIAGAMTYIALTRPCFHKAAAGG